MFQSNILRVFTFYYFIILPAKCTCSSFYYDTPCIAREIKACEGQIYKLLI